MSVATGIAPGALMELDGDMFDAVRLALARRWTPETELAAAAVEIADAHLVAYQRVHAKKGARIPDPRPIARPEHAPPATGDGAPRRASFAEVAAMGGRIVEVDRAG